MTDFFVSYNRHDKDWAEWIAWTLEEAGYSVTIQAWDIRPGDNFVVSMHKAAIECEKTIAVLSPNYLGSDYTQDEWAAAFEPNNRERKLIPVRIADCEVTGLFKRTVYVDLVGLTPEAARLELLGAFSDRAKPATAPAFPGAPSETKASAPKAFPGETTGSGPDAAALEAAGNAVAKLIEAPTPVSSVEERLALQRKLNAILPKDFNMLIGIIKPPPGYIPSVPAAQADRTQALFDWAESPSGCGLPQIKKILDLVLNPR